MTQSLARLLALPFVLYLIYFFTSGAYERSQVHTYIVLGCMIALALLYVFQYQINIWYWKRKPPRLSKKLLSWVAHHSGFYTSLSSEDQLKLEQRIALFIKLKTFTLKVDKDAELEEDMKALVAHEFQRLVFNRDDYQYEDYDQFIFYNHPFPTPTIEQLHALEIHDEHGVVIMSREQFINGVANPEQINIGLLAAIITFVRMYPRLEYPSLTELSLEHITEGMEIGLEPLEALMGESWIKKLELLIYLYFEMPKKLEGFNGDVFQSLNLIFDWY